MRNYLVTDVNEQFRFPDYFLSRFFSTAGAVTLSLCYLAFMTISGYSNAIVNTMLSWLKGFANWVLRLFNLAGSSGGTVVTLKAEYLGKLNSGTGELVDGVEEFDDGMQEMLDGVEELNDAMLRVRDEGIAKVRLIVPHSEGHTSATTNVYPCFYEILYQEMRE